MNVSDPPRKKNRALIAPRVLLRRPAKRDLEEFIALNRASVRMHRGLASPPKDAEEFARFLRRSRRPDCACFLICLVEGGSIVGSINLSQIFPGGFRNAYLGYHVGAQYSRRGYMTEAIELMLRYAFDDLKLHRLEANIQPENTASIALVKRVGFVREGYSRRYLKVCGRWRDHERWAIISEEWQTRRKHSVG
jgi:ribosomal-protein-alanine N-acetyltransferase